MKYQIQWIANCECKETPKAVQCQLGYVAIVCHICKKPYKPIVFTTN